LRFAEFLQDVPNSIVRLHPAMVQLSNGLKVGGGYYFMEILCREDCFDFETSEYDRSSIYDFGNSPIVRRCTRFELRGGREICPISFVEKVAFSDPLIEEGLAHKLTAAKLQDVSLIPTSEFVWDV